MESVVDLLQALVRTPSVNPDSDPAVAPGGEEEVARLIAGFLQPLSFTVTFEEVEPGRPNLIARAPGPSDRPRLLLAPHLDTVGISGMTVDPFAAILKDGKIWGRGASDTKGSIAAMLWGLRENAGRLASLPVAVDFAAFMGEETQQPGSRHFAKRHASEYDFAIAGEPTSLEAVRCNKGCLWVTLEAEGRAAHASQPHLGDNAILKLLAGIQDLQGKFLTLLSEARHPVLGSATMNVGQISGGSRPNIVPEKATAQLDIRTVPALVEKQSAFDLLCRHLDHLKVSKVMESPPMEVAAAHPWVTRLQEMMPGLRLTGAPWFSDAAHLAAAGLPAICLGPGSIAQAHTADEYLAVDDLEAGAAWFTAMITALGH